MTVPTPYANHPPPFHGGVPLGQLAQLKAFDLVGRPPVTRLGYRLERLVTRVAAMAQLTSVTLGRDVRTYGRVRVVNEGNVVISDSVTFVGGVTPFEMWCATGSTIRLGARSTFNYGSFLLAQGAGIEIGEDCLIASRVLIRDVTDEARGRVVVEDNVWLANGVTLLPGVRIGRGSTVAAGSIVSQDVPPHCLAVGAPARCVPLTGLRS